MAFGSVVHRTIEMLGKGMPESELEDTIRFLADEEGMAEELISESVRVVRSVIASELWQRSLRARRRLFEVPLMIRKKMPTESADLAMLGVQHQRLRLHWKVQVQFSMPMFVES